MDLFSVCRFVGVFVVRFLLIRTAVFIFRNFYYYVYPRDQGARLRAYGKWAVVTGCTDGIGREYALRLAKYGLNVFLISRSADKLDSVAAEISNECKDVETRTLAVDFTQLDIYDTIEKQLRDLDIGVLINNVGMSSFEEAAPKLGDKKREFVVDVISCNAVSMVGMSNIVLPKMQAQRRGLVVNISSGSAVVTIPYLTVYGATKAFAKYFSDATRVEYAEYGVEVQTATPLFIHTKLARRKQVSFFVRTVKAFVTAHINTFGIGSAVAGCIPHEIQILFHKAIMALWIRDRVLIRAGKKIIGLAQKQTEKIQAASLKSD